MLVGVNGVGKLILFKCLIGYMLFCDGEILIFGEVFCSVLSGL